MSTQIPPRVQRELIEIARDTSANISVTMLPGDRLSALQGGGRCSALRPGRAAAFDWRVCQSAAPWSSRLVATLPSLPEPSVPATPGQGDALASRCRLGLGGRGESIHSFSRRGAAPRAEAAPSGSFRFRPRPHLTSIRLALELSQAPSRDRRAPLTRAGSLCWT